MPRSIIIYLFLTGCAGGVAHKDKNQISELAGAGLRRGSGPRVELPPPSQLDHQEPSASCERIISNFLFDAERAGGVVGGTITGRSLFYFAKYKTSLDLLVISPPGDQGPVPANQSPEKGSCTKNGVIYQSTRAFGLPL